MPVRRARARVRAPRPVLFTTLALALTASPSAAQRIALDLEPVGGSASIAWARSPSSALGFGVGVTVPQLVWNVAPENLEYEELAHVVAFYRATAAPFETDLGLRIAAGELYRCETSDCSTGVLVGLYAGFLAGWDPVRFGMRVVFGSYAESGESRATVVSITPLIVRIAFGR